VAYISPEQARALPIDERSDLFSCGTIVWEMLCNRRLFHRGAEAPTLMALVHGEIPPPSEERSLFDTGWDTLVMRALEREVDDRAASATELLHILDKIDAAHSPDDMPEALAALVRQCRADVPTKTDEPRTAELGAEPVTQVLP
jgi:serine/threonine-protein kinase